MTLSTLGGVSVSMINQEILCVISLNFIGSQCNLTFNLVFKNQLKDMCL